MVWVDGVLLRGWGVGLRWALVVGWGFWGWVGGWLGVGVLGLGDVYIGLGALVGFGGGAFLGGWGDAPTLTLPRRGRGFIGCWGEFWLERGFGLRFGLGGRAGLGGFGGNGD